MGPVCSWKLWALLLTSSLSSSQERGEGTAVLTSHSRALREEDHGLHSLSPAIPPCLHTHKNGERGWHGCPDTIIFSVCKGVRNPGAHGIQPAAETLVSHRVVQTSALALVSVDLDLHRVGRSTTWTVLKGLHVFISTRP